MFSELLDGSNVSFIAAYVGGFVTFFASCLLPLVPTYLAYLSGTGLATDGEEVRKVRVFVPAVFFVVGFVATFVVLGLSLTHLGGAVNLSRPIIERIAGLLFIVLGLFMLGVFKHRIFSQERRINVHNKLATHRKLHALLAGIGFGFGWTPCIGPVLAVILFWSVQAETQLQGILLLIAYGVGLGTPFLIVALGFERLLPMLKKYRRVSQFIGYFSGGLVLVVGIAMLAGEFREFSFRILEVFDLQRIAR